MVHLARCATQDYKADTSDMNNTQSQWSLPSLSFWVFMVLMQLCLIFTSDCLYWILAFTVTKHDTTTWTNDILNFSKFWTCSFKATRNDCNCLKHSLLRDFPKKKNVSEQQLACRWTWSM